MTSKEEMLNILKEKVVTIKFKKKDDTIRRMVCTLSKEYLPDTEDNNENIEKRVKKENPNTIPVWDLEKLSWRSFRIDSVVEYESNF